MKSEVQLLAPVIVDPCDACGAANAVLRCSQCKCSYYCNKVCQKRHWKVHQSDCRGITMECTELNQLRDESLLFIQRYDESLTEDCCICFESVAETQKLQLACHHIFCTKCLAIHQDNHFFDGATCCPLCRTSTQLNIFQYAYMNVRRLWNRSNKFPPQSEIREHFIIAARKEYTRLMELISSTSLIVSSPHYNRQALLDILVTEERFEEAIIIAKELLTNTHVQNEKQVYYQVLCSYANACEGLGLYQQAWDDALLPLFKEFSTPNINTVDRCRYDREMRLTYDHVCKCLYHLGRYEKAIFAGLLAIQVSRYHEHIHEYLARSYQALGYLDEAIAVIRRAIRYEVLCVDPEQHKANLQAKLQEMLAEQAAIALSSSRK